MLVGKWAAFIEFVFISNRLGFVESVDSSDLLGSKVWLDRHLFNMTLKTTMRTDGSSAWMINQAKARDRNLPWPPVSRPTLCFLGLGPSSIGYFKSIARFFPDLRLVLLEVEDQRWLRVLDGEFDRMLPNHIELGDIQDFSELRGPHRQTCQAISWSADTPPFSFHRYRDLFYSTPYMLAFFNLQGCTRETRSDAVDRYYCDYLYSSFQATLCGRVNENRSAEYHGEEIYFPLVNSGCGEVICMCHAPSDAFLDFHFESLCRQGQQHRFMGQWGQDRFLLENVFGKDLDSLRGKGIYVDVGASHPFHLSNTAYFDKCWDWQGVCIEPNPRCRPPLRAFRSCKVLTSCAWANTTSMVFDGGGELAAVADDTIHLPNHTDTANAVDGQFEANCSSLHELLLAGVAANGHKHSSRIDLLSVDAEGAEVEIFRDFPFSSWDIRAIIIEISRRTAMAIDSLLLPRGFHKIAVLGKDAVYVHRRVVERLPIDGPRLPERIIWNEPGTEEDTIEYFRFQRKFGVDGDLDVEVGDQRLLNETEIQRQHQRFNASQTAAAAEIKEAARGAIVGGILSDEQREALELTWVREAMSDVEVQAAIELLSHEDQEAFVRKVQANDHLKSKLQALIKVGALKL